MTPRTIMIAVAVCILLAFIGMKRIRAQAHVESASYDLMLSTLLSHSVPEINVKEAIADSEAVLLDGREKPEFNVSHIPGALWIGYDDFTIDRLQGVDTSAHIIVYCSVGYRSEKISEKLRKAGYRHVSNLYGGIFEWVNQGQPIVGADGATTDKVHAYSKSWGVWLNKGQKVYE